MNKNIMLLEIDTIIEFLDFLLEEEISEEDLDIPEDRVYTDPDTTENSKCQ